MKTIGFIDYYLSEWHANNYPSWIKEEMAKIGEEFVVKYAWGEIDSLVDGKTNKEWCDEFGVELCDSIEDVCKKADFIFILSPSNPEKHLEYAKRVFPFAKPTYVDKTFTPDYKSAEEIFNIAKKYGTPFFSSSALRFATELSQVENAVSLITTGGGSNIEEYAVHQLEMICKTINDKPIRLKRNLGENGANEISIEFENGRFSKLIHHPSLDFSLNAKFSNGDEVKVAVHSPYFNGLINSILKFFLDKKVPFSTHQTLTVMKIREKLVESLKTTDEWINI